MVVVCSCCYCGDGGGWPFAATAGRSCLSPSLFFSVSLHLSLSPSLCVSLSHCENNQTRIMRTSEPYVVKSSSPICSGWLWAPVSGSALVTQSRGFPRGPTKTSKELLVNLRARFLKLRTRNGRSWADCSGTTIPHQQAGFTTVKCRQLKISSL